ncbi:hypothetical protein C8Q76DRAFT_217234 [Earliella scabrosa]|nr:hypothetical protein C8Q76DRAFT_217234 [Earliella scabrosa]
MCSGPMRSSARIPRSIVAPHKMPPMPFTQWPTSTRKPRTCLAMGRTRGSRQRPRPVSLAARALRPRTIQGCVGPIAYHGGTCRCNESIRGKVCTWDAAEAPSSCQVRLTKYPYPLASQLIRACVPRLTNTESTLMRLSWPFAGSLRCRKRDGCVRVLVPYILYWYADTSFSIRQSGYTLQACPQGRCTLLSSRSLHDSHDASATTPRTAQSESDRLRRLQPSLH